MAALPTLAMAAEVQPGPAGAGFGGAIDVQPGSIDGQVVLEPGSVMLRARLVDPGVEGQLQVALPGIFVASANASNGVLTYALAACGAGATFGIEGTRNSGVRVSFSDAASGTQPCAAPPPAAAFESMVMGAFEPVAAQTQAPATDDGLTVLANWLRRFVGFGLIALLMVFLIPALPRALATATQSAPWARIGTGVALALTLPLIGLLVFALGLGIGLWWLGVLVLALYPVLLVLSMIMSGLALGSFLGRASRQSMPIMLTSAVGLAILTLASVLPYIGPIVSVLAIIFGLGVLVLAPRSFAPRASEPASGHVIVSPEPDAPLPPAPLAAA